MTHPDHSHTVRHRFSAAAQTYETHAAIQTLAAEQVLAMCPPRLEPPRLCEAGCGTGLLTRRLLRQYPEADVVAIDIAKEMIRQARQLTPAEPRLCWQLADAATFQNDTPFPLVVSNCSLHWVQPMDRLFRNLARLLTARGNLVFSLMLHDTFQELHELRLKVAPHKPPSARLPRLNEVVAQLKNSGFEVKIAKKERHRQNFPSAEAFLRGIHEMGLTGGAVSRARQPLTRQELEQLTLGYEQTCRSGSEGVLATYEVGYIHAVRPS